MRLALATLVVSLAWTACSVAGADRPATAALGQAFSLRPGQAAQAADQAWQVGFDGVAADSRCPRGVRCVWAGQATLRLWLQAGAGPRQALELHATPAPVNVVRSQGYELRLVGLEPYPAGDRPVAAGEYVATLQVTHPAAAAPER